MIRSFGLRTLTGNAQPPFGDRLTAAFSNIKSEPNGFYFVSVANAGLYQLGDRIILGYGGASTTNCLMVGGVNTGTNILSCISEGNAPVKNWPINTQIVLNIACAVLTIIAPATNVGNIWFGSDDTVTNSGGGSAFAEIFPSGSYPFGLAGWNTLRTSEVWIAGTLNDNMGVSAIIV